MKSIKLTSLNKGNTDEKDWKTEDDKRVFVADKTSGFYFLAIDAIE